MRPTAKALYTTPSSPKSPPSQPAVFLVCLSLIYVCLAIWDTRQGQIHCTHSPEATEFVACLSLDLCMTGDTGYKYWQHRAVV